MQYLSVAVRLLLGDRLSQGHELVAGVRRVPATAAAWILDYRQQPTRRRGHHLRPVFQGASNRPTRSLLNLSKAAKPYSVFYHKTCGTAAQSKENWLIITRVWLPQS